MENKTELSKVITEVIRMKKEKVLDADLIESESESMLCYATCDAMKRKLAENHKRGRSGWWDKGRFTIGRLYELRQNALDDDDHISVMNYTAMIAARGSHAKNLVRTKL